MPLETASYVGQLVDTNPAHSDGVNQGDSHLRLIKSCLVTTFPNANSAVSNWDLVAAVGNDTGLQFTADTTASIGRTATGVMTIKGQLTGNGSVPTGSVHMFARDPGTTMMARGGTATGTEQFIYLDGSSYPTATFPTLGASPFVTVSGTNFTVDQMADTGRFPRQQGGNAGNAGATGSNAFASHSHSITDVAHNHGVNDPGHSHGVYDPGHNHYVNDPGHAHTVTIWANTPGGTYAQDIPGQYYNPATVGTSGSGTGIWLNASGTNIGIYGSGTGVYNSASGTGLSTTNANGGVETRPEYITFIFAIKT